MHLNKMAWQKRNYPKVFSLSHQVNNIRNMLQRGAFVTHPEAEQHNTRLLFQNRITLYLSLSCETNSSEMFKFIKSVKNFESENIKNVLISDYTTAHLSKSVSRGNAFKSFYYPNMDCIWFLLYNKDCIFTRESSSLF